MNNSPQAQLIAETARALVYELDEQELPFFEAISVEFFAKFDKVGIVQIDDDELLGFGAGETIAWASVVLPVVAEIVRFLTDEVKKSIKEQSADRINETVKKYFTTPKTGDEEVENLTLTPEQTEWIHKLIARKARQFGISNTRAKLLADAVIGSFVTTSKKK